MEVTQSRIFDHPQEFVWDRLMDYRALARSLPGVERLQPLDDPDTFELTVKVAIPSITGAYKGSVHISDRKPHESYRLTGEAKGRLGWVKGSADFALSTVEQGTEVVAVMDVRTGGVLSGVGQRFMHSITSSMIRDFFTAFEQELTSQSA